MIVLRASTACFLAFAGTISSAAQAPPQENNSLQQSLEPTRPESGLVLRDSAEPLRFFDVTGRKAGVFGKQNGQFEAWIYPIKLLHNFRLEFQEEGQLQPIRGESLLRQVETRPESAALVYVHPNFTVREVIWTPLNEPAIVISFEVDTAKALDVTAAFVPDFKPMWPASLGGQHSYWNSEEKAFVLTDGTEQPTAIVGSPAITSYSEFTDHQLAAGETLLRTRFLPGESRAAHPPIVMALSMEGERTASAIYRDVLSRSNELFEQRVEHHRQFLERTFAFESPDAELNKDFAWAKVAIDAGWVCHAEYGCGLVAGYGPAGVGERPGFAWWFGGDAMMSSWALEDFGDLDGALQALRFLKNRQRNDGKIMHEMTQSVDLLDWFGKYHYAYYHADATPMYLYSLGEYWKRTGDTKFLNEFWDSAEKAYEYCLSTVTPADGLMDNTKAGLAAVEVGVLRGKVVKDIYLEGFWVAALEAMRGMAAGKGDQAVAGDASQRVAKALQSLQTNWWMSEQHAFAFGITSDGKRTDLIGVWPSVLLALSDSLDSQQAAASAKNLGNPAIATDWGARWLSNKHELYDPLSYNNGTAWPFMSGFAAWAEYRRDSPLAGFSLWSSVAHLTGLSSPGAVPELMNGDRYLPGEFAVPHQLFSSDGVILPAVRGLLGLQCQGPAAEPGAPMRVSFAPSLPADWPFLRFKRYAVGSGRLDGEVSQSPGQVTMRVKYEGGSPISIVLSPAAPALARIKSLKVDGKPAKSSLSVHGSFTRVETQPLTLRPNQELLLTIEYDGGIGFVPPNPRPQPGDRTQSLKILDVQSNAQNRGCILQMTVAGIGGRTYPLRIVSSLPNLTAGGLPLAKIENGYEVQIPFKGAGYVERQVCFAD